MANTPVFRSEEKLIGEHTYKITVLDAVAGRHALVRLSKLAGAAVNGSNTFAAMVASAVSTMTEADVDYFIELFEPRTTVSGGAYSAKSTRLSAVATTHFVDNYFELVEWLIFCLTENFRSFFEGAAKLLKDRAAEAAAKKANATSSSSQTTPTGTSGA